MRRVIVILMFVSFFCGAVICSGQQKGASKILILYHTKTGKTKVACEALKKELGADMIEIRALEGKIEPEKPDLAAYPYLIIGSPIWASKLCAPIRTLIEKNRLEGKKVVIFTTANVPSKEYEEKNKALVTNAGGQVVGFYCVASKDKVGSEMTDRPDAKITEDALRIAPEIKKAFSLLP